LIFNFILILSADNVKAIEGSTSNKNGIPNLAAEEKEEIKKKKRKIKRKKRRK